MTSLIIKDLSATTELDRPAMLKVRGGTGKGQYQYNGAGGVPYADVSKNSFGFDATQVLDQCQNTQVNNGNNVAFASGITANVNPSQTGSNNIRFGR